MVSVRFFFSLGVRKWAVEIDFFFCCIFSLLRFQCLGLWFVFVMIISSQIWLPLWGGCLLFLLDGESEISKSPDSIREVNEQTLSNDALLYTSSSIFIHVSLWLHIYIYICVWYIVCVELYSVLSLADEIERPKFMGLSDLCLHGWSRDRCLKTLKRAYHTDRASGWWDSSYAVCFICMLSICMCVSACMYAPKAMMQVLWLIPHHVDVVCDFLTLDLSPFHSI